MSNQESKKQKIERIAKSLLSLMGIEKNEIEQVWGSGSLDLIKHESKTAGGITERSFLLQIAHRIYNERNLNTPCIIEKMKISYNEGYQLAYKEMTIFIDQQGETR